MFGVSREQERVIEFVLACHDGRVFGNPIPDSIEHKVSRRKVENFAKALGEGKFHYVPEGLDFFGKVTWERIIKEHMVKRFGA